jgi:hypothetical protein
MKKKSVKYYLKIIDQIQNTRKSNNINWMNILRIAFKSDPKSAIKCMKRISTEDNKISRLVQKLTV